MPVSSHTELPDYWYEEGRRRGQHQAPKGMRARYYD